MGWTGCSLVVLVDPLIQSDHVQLCLQSNSFHYQTNPPQVSPVQQLRQPLSSVALDDTLPPRLLAETEHELGQLVAGLLGGPEASVHYVDTWQREESGRVTKAKIIQEDKHTFFKASVYHMQQGPRHAPLRSSQSLTDWWSHWECPLQYTQLENSRKTENIQ